MTGTYPEDVNSSVNFGNTIRALAVTMDAYGMTSYERIAEMLTGLIGETISGTSVMNWVELASSKLEDVLALIKEALLNSYFGHCDETGVGEYEADHLGFESDGRQRALAVRRQ